MLRKAGKWILRIGLALVALVLAAATFAAFLPVTTDPWIADDEAGVGSVAVTPSWSGLLREFPPPNNPADNPQSEAKVALGRELFFDPVLSADATRSCATCHHPDLGFSNGQPHADTRNQRNVPTLWNIAFVRFLNWDGSVTTLEEQAITPLTHADEMGATPDLVVERLSAHPAYSAAFERAFGTPEISADRALQAIAAFQRTLLNQNSPFDRYAAGEFDALTPQQRRGLALFRSGATRCFECHAIPTFAQDTFRVVGVESDDPGRAGVAETGVHGAFRVPTLRNVALTAPYMHNGSMQTLEEVVQFYADGGGRARGASGIDPFIFGFALNDQEKADLVAFMHALTDESALPEIPARALSGLPTVAHIDNPVRREVARTNIGSSPTAPASPRDPVTLTVSPGQRVQAAIDRARPGDTIAIRYGLYHERVVIDMSDITIEGIPNDSGEYPVFDGQGVLSEAIIASGNNFAAGKLHMRNFTDNGILVEGVTGVHLYDLITENTGIYGVYPTKSTDVLVERVRASGVIDAGIYAGQCRNVVIRDSVAFDNVIGIELENTLNGEAYNNHVYENSMGILVVVLPQLPAKISRDSRVYDNLIENNNRPNDALPGMVAEMVPPGVGILLLGADDADVTGNTVRNHRTAGIAVFSLTVAYNANELDVGPLPENNRVYLNSYENNGYDPVPSVRELGIPVGDLMWDGSGWNNRFNEPTADKGFPVIFPGENWPQSLRKLHYQVITLIVRLFG
jgi:parallel beta-helix repeat protein